MSPERGRHGRTGGSSGDTGTAEDTGEVMERDEDCLNPFHPLRTALGDVDICNFLYFRKFFFLPIPDGYFVQPKPVALAAPADLLQAVEKLPLVYKTMLSRSLAAPPPSAPPQPAGPTGGVFARSVPRLWGPAAGAGVVGFTPAPEGSPGGAIPIPVGMPGVRPPVAPTTLGIPPRIWWYEPPFWPRKPVPPRLWLVERYRLSTCYVGFGLGEQLYTLTLLPEEEVSIEIKTWYTSETKQSESRSIFDSHTEEAEQDFEQTLQSEFSTTNKTTDEQYISEGHFEIGIPGVFSISAGASGGVGTKTERDEFAKAVRNTTSKLATKASRERRIEITQSNEAKVTTGEENRTQRKFRNINKCHTVNFNYFQVVRKYKVRLELIDVLVRYVPGILLEALPEREYSEVPIPVLELLLERAIVPDRRGDVRTLVAGPLGNDDLDILASKGKPLALKPEAFPRLIEEHENVVKTNGVYVEPILGKCTGCEPFIEAHREMDLRLKALMVDRAKILNDKLGEPGAHAVVVSTAGEKAATSLNLDLKEAKGPVIITPAE